MLPAGPPRQSQLANSVRGDLDSGGDRFAFYDADSLYDHRCGGHSLPLYFLRPADGGRLLRAWPHLDADGAMAFRSMVPAFGDSGDFGMRGPDRDWHAAAESTSGFNALENRAASFFHIESSVYS